MIKPEIIKELIEMFEPEGFRISEDGKSFYLPDAPYDFKRLMQENTFDYLPKWELVYNPLFLQRVIEGINRKLDTQDESLIVDFNGYQGGYQFTYLQHETCSHKHSMIFDDIDNCKENAIMYIYNSIKGE